MILLKDIILILSLAIILILILSKFKIAPVFGFLITGVIIGPSSLQLVQSVAEIEILAEIGVILLMFTIGLEFSLDKIKKMLKDFFLFGGLQVVSGWMVFGGLLFWYGLLLYQALLGGFILALSSTVIVLKLLQEKNELNTPSGIKMTGILLFQDAVIIPAMILLPFINQIRQTPLPAVGLNFLFAIGGVILIFFASKRLLPILLNIIFKLRIPDLLTITVFVFLFGVAMIAHEIGVSLAMGAFIVGIAISDSDFAHQINSDILPSRNIFNSIFFISIGMFVNIAFLKNHFTEVFLVTLVIIIVKLVLILLIFVISRQALSTGIKTAFGLAHIGEFSYILLRVAKEHTIFTQDIHQILLSSAILSMFTIPVALKIGKKISRFEKLKKELPLSSQPKSLSNHTVIAGYGINGRNIARILKLLDIPYAVLDLNPATVKKYKSLGEPIYFGNIDHKDNMKFIGIEKAFLLIIAINDTESAGKAIKLARDVHPSLKIIARVDFLTEVEYFYYLGADLVLAQDMETSLIFIHHILKFYNVPDHVARIQTNLLRKEHYRFFLKQESREAWKIAMLDFIEQDNELFFISPFSKHVSKKIPELKPYFYKDMKIIGVIRKDKVLSRSLEDVIVEKYDTIIFSGNHKKVFEALTWMEENN